MGFLDATGITTLVTRLKDYFALKSELNAKQDTLVSGTNIKTVNNNSLVGSGNVSIPTPTSVSDLRDTSVMTAQAASGIYRLWFSSVDGVRGVPINTSTSSSSLTQKPLNTTIINPFYPIYYCTQSASQGTSISNNNLYCQKNINLQYSYVISLTRNKPVYLKCSPNASGGVEMKDIVQVLPTSLDGYVYLYLGYATSSTDISLEIVHPIFYYDGTRVRLWTGESIS